MSSVAFGLPGYLKWTEYLAQNNSKCSRLKTHKFYCLQGSLENKTACFYELCKENGVIALMGLGSVDSSSI